MSNTDRDVSQAQLGRMRGSLDGMLGLLKKPKEAEGNNIKAKYLLQILTLSHRLRGHYLYWGSLSLVMPMHVRQTMIPCLYCWLVYCATHE